MTRKGIIDGAFIAGLVLIWLDVASGQPADVWAALLVTAPVILRTAAVVRPTKKVGSDG